MRRLVNPSLRAAAAAALGASSIAACGARSDLDPIERISGGTGGSNGTGAGSEGGAAPDPCILESAGESIEVVTYSEGHADGPSLAAVTVGTEQALVIASISEDANFWHPELRLARVRAGGAWPGSVTTDAGPTTVGADAHAWGRIAALDDGTVGISWFRGDEAAGVPSGVKFRHFDAVGWSAGPDVFIDPEGDMTYQIALGPVPSGTGFAIAHRTGTPESGYRPQLAFVDASGTVTTGPALAGSRPYPALPADVVWSGQHWIVGVPFGQCAPGDALCTPNSLVFGRAAIDKPIERAAEVSAIPGLIPRRPWIARAEDRLVAAWTEGPDDDTAPRTIRWVELDGTGSLAGDIETVASNVSLTWSISLGGSEAGVVLTWGQVADPGLPNDHPSHSKLVVHHRDRLRNRNAFQVPTPAFTFNSPSGAPIGWKTPRGFVTAWAATNEVGVSSIRLARLECR